MADNQKAVTVGEELRDPLLSQSEPSETAQEDENVDVIVAGTQVSDEDQQNDLDGKETKDKSDSEEKETCIQRFFGFEVRFWICTVSCVLCYGIVQAYNYNSETVLLERNYFTAAQNITECCCWKPSQCFTSWPDPQNENRTISASEFPDCVNGCTFSDTQQPVVNLTVEQFSHIDCNANASTKFGLSGDEWGYNDPAIPAFAGETYLSYFCNMSTNADVVSANVAAIPYDVGVVLSPFLGIFLDRIGGTALIMTLTPAGFALAHVLLGLFRDVPALVPLLVQGVSYSFYSAALWAPIAHVMPEKKQGVGYGIITAALNFGTAVFPLIVAAIYNDSNFHYLPNTEYLFMALAAAAFVLGVWLCGVDWRGGKELSRSHWNDNAGDKDATQPVAKANLKMRWPVLIFICLMMVGNFYISELTALKQQLADEFSDIPTAEFELNYELLYTIYAFPNIILPFFGGVLVDKFGTRSTLLGFGILLTVAQCIFALGCNLHMFWLMLVARGIYALAGETITVAQNVILTDWYRGREHAFSFGITLSFCRGGNSLASYLSPIVAAQYGVAAALWVGAGICLFCVLCTLVLIPLDLYAEKKIKKLHEKEVME